MNSFWVQSFEFIIIFLFWTFAAVMVGWSYPYFLVALLIWIIAFIIAKSTKVPLDPEAIPITQYVKLSYRDYHRWAQKYSYTNIPMDYYDRTDKHWTEKTALLMTSKEATSHMMQPSPSILKMAFLAILFFLLLFLPEVKLSVAIFTRGLPMFQLIIFQVFIGLLVGYFSGTACGKFYRWFRAKI